MLKSSYVQCSERLYTASNKNVKLQRKCDTEKSATSKTKLLLQTDTHLPESRLQHRSAETANCFHGTGSNSDILPGPTTALPTQ